MAYDTATGTAVLFGGDAFPARVHGHLDVEMTLVLQAGVIIGREGDGPAQPAPRQAD